MTVVLDAWAVIEILRGGAAGARARELADRETTLMSSINLGEVEYALIRSHGEDVAEARVEGVRQAIRVEDPDWSLVRSSARFKANGGLSYADAFCLATASRHGAAIATGDPEILDAATALEMIDVRAD